MTVLCLETLGPQVQRQRMSASWQHTTRGDVYCAQDRSNAACPPLFLPDKPTVQVCRSNTAAARNNGPAALFVSTTNRRTGCLGQFRCLLVADCRRGARFTHPRHALNCRRSEHARTGLTTTVCAGHPPAAPALPKLPSPLTFAPLERAPHSAPPSWSPQSTPSTTASTDHVRTLQS